MTEEVPDQECSFISNFRCGFDDHGMIVIQFMDYFGENSFPIMLFQPEFAEATAMALLQVCKNISGESVQ